MTAHDRTDHVADADVAGLAALEAADAARIAAVAHVRQCADCRAKWNAAERLVALLAVGQPSPPAPAVLARASARVLEALAAETPPASSVQPVSAPWSPRQSLGLVVAAAVVYAVVTSASARTVSSVRAWVTGAAVLATAVLASSLVGSSRGARWALVLAFGAAGLSAVAFGSDGDVVFSHGIVCGGLELVTGAGALAAGLYAARRRATALGTLTGAALAATGALAAQGALAVGCGAAIERPHLIVFHFLPVLVSAAAGALIARAFGATPAR